MNLGPGKCRVCLQWKDKLEEEHVLSDWFAHQVEKYGPFTLPDREPQRRPEFFLLPVCRGCNKRLGRTIEDPASVLLKPWAIHPPTSRQVFSGADQKILARWAVKVMAMMALLHTTDQPPSAFRDWLQAKGSPEPPPGTTVWVGSFVVDALPMSDEEKQLIAPRYDASVEWAPILGVGNVVVSLAYRYTQLPWLIADRAKPLDLLPHPAETLGFLRTLRFGEDDTLHWPLPKAIGRTSYVVLYDFFIV